MESYYSTTLWHDEINEPLTFFDSFDGYIYPEYQNGKIVKVHGGLLQSVMQWPTHYYEPLCEDWITYRGDTITVREKANFIERPEVNSYVIRNGRLVYRRYESGTVGAAPIEFSYEYSDDLVTEFSFGRINRKFHLTNGNLTKVERPIYGLDGQPNGTSRLLNFSNYGTTENHLKGKFFLRGAFYTAFSNNNFNAINKAYFDGQQENPGFGISFTLPQETILFNRSCD